MHILSPFSQCNNKVSYNTLDIQYGTNTCRQGSVNDTQPAISKKDKNAYITTHIITHTQCNVHALHDDRG